MATLHTVLIVLESIFLVAGEVAFNNLYASGDKLVQRTIKRLPLRCTWKPNKYSENIVRLSLIIRDHAFVECSGKVLLEADAFPFPRLPTLRRLKIDCSSEDWERIWKCVGNIESLRLEMWCGELHGLPSGLKSLKIRCGYHEFVKYMPSGLTRLDLNVPRMASYDVLDLSHLPLLEYNGGMVARDVMFPKTLAEVQCDSPGGISGNYPDLKWAVLERISGTYKNLMYLSCCDGDISGCTHPEIVIDTEKGQYSDGILYMSTGDVSLFYHLPIVEIRAYFFRHSSIMEHFDSTIRNVPTLRNVSFYRNKEIQFYSDGDILENMPEDFEKNGVIVRYIRDISQTPLRPGWSRYI